MIGVFIIPFSILPHYYNVYKSGGREMVLLSRFYGIHPTVI